MPETSASNAGPDRPPPPKAPKPPKPPKAPKLPKPPAAPGPPQNDDSTPWDQPKLSDPEQLRALAHPARLAVWDFLGTCQLEGRDGATATECAEAAGMTPSAMSYHLRTLAKAGFIEEAPGRGDARERVWRIGIHSFSFGADADSPESVKLAQSAASQALTASFNDHYLRWEAAKFDADPQVRDASLFTQSRLRLTPEEADAIRQGIHALLEPHQRRTVETLESGKALDESDDVLLWNFTARLFPHL